MMEGAKPGHTVRFHGLKGASHLNETEGTLVKYLKKEKRWSVRCDSDGSVVSAKPENLILHRHYQSASGHGYGPQTRPRDGDYVSWMGPGGSGRGRAGASSGAKDASSWAAGLAQKDRYEWFSNCYQMRCDDDYAWGGCNLHGPYNPDATPASIVDDFLIYCVLADRAGALPSGWDWKAFLGAAADYIPFAFEKSDAKERWGSENYFEGQMGGRSLRYTGTEIYKSDVNKEGDSREYAQAEQDARTRKAEMQAKLGGKEAWNNLAEDLSKGKRFA